MIKDIVAAFVYFLWFILFIFAGSVLLGTGSVGAMLLSIVLFGIPLAIITFICAVLVWSIETLF